MLPAPRAGGPTQTREPSSHPRVGLLRWPTFVLTFTGPQVISIPLVLGAQPVRRQRKTSQSLECEKAE